MEHTIEGTTKKEIQKKIMAMILPITVEKILQSMAGFVTMAMLGRLDAVTVSAVGLGIRISQIIWGLFRGVTVGAAVFVAQYYGAGDFKGLRKIIQQMLLSSILIVIVIQQLIYWWTPSVISIFGASGELMVQGVTYLKIVSWGLPFMVVVQVVAASLQGMGDAKTPMKIATIMNVINVIVGFLLIFGIGFVPALGMRGAAYAMILSQVVACLLSLYVVFNKDGVLASVYNRNFFKIDIKQIFTVYKVGMPTALEAVFWQVSSVLLINIILIFGETALAAYQLGLQAEAISFMPAMGFGVVTTALIGQALGAKDKELCREYMREIIKGSLLLTSVSTFVLIFLPHLVMRLLTDQQEMIQIGAQYLFFMGIAQIPQNLTGVLNGAMRGAGFTRVPMIVAGAGLWLVRIPFAWILTHYFNMSITIVWVVMSVDLIVRFLLSLVLYKTKDIYNTETLLVEKA